jgi:chaperonin cofactor prefoldin
LENAVVKFVNQFVWLTRGETIALVEFAVAIILANVYPVYVKAASRFLLELVRDYDLHHDQFAGFASGFVPLAEIATRWNFLSVESQAMALDLSHSLESFQERHPGLSIPQTLTDHMVLRVKGACERYRGLNYAERAKLRQYLNAELIRTTLAKHGLSTSGFDIALSDEITAIIDKRKRAESDKRAISRANKKIDKADSAAEVEQIAGDPELRKSLIKVDADLRTVRRTVKRLNDLRRKHVEWMAKQRKQLKEQAKEEAESINAMFAARKEINFLENRVAELVMENMKLRQSRGIALPPIPPEELFVPLHVPYAEPPFACSMAEPGCHTH